MNAFEEQMYRNRRRQLRFLLSLPVLLALLIGMGIYVYTYHINRFSLELNLHGEENLVIEYGGSYTEAGADARFFLAQGCLRRALRFLCRLRVGWMRVR